MAAARPGSTGNDGAIDVERRGHGLRDPHPREGLHGDRSQTARFRELHAKDGAPIEHRKVSSKTGREVPKDGSSRAIETSPGRYVVLTDEEIRPSSSRERKAIEVEHFVPAEQVDPVFYDSAYYLGAQDEGATRSRRCSRALEKTERVGIGRFVLRAKRAARRAALRATASCG